MRDALSGVQSPLAIPSPFALLLLQCLDLGDEERSRARDEKQFLITTFFPLCRNFRSSGIIDSMFALLSIKHVFTLTCA
ncbi:unnamed protein product, partial [Sphagnum tenellum]